MARTRRIKLDGDMNYHVMSRTNDRQFLFKSDSVKTELADALRRAAAFCGVALKAYAVMDNHFHAIVRVTKPRGPVGANELLRRVGILRGERAMHSLATRDPGGRAESFSLPDARRQRVCQVVQGGVQSRLQARTEVLRQPLVGALQVDNG